MQQNIHNKIDANYIRKSYLISLIWAGAILIPVYLGNAKDVDSVTFGVVSSAILFPFARLVYDLIIGFKFYEKFGHHIFVERFIFFIYLIILVFSIPLAPFGILYLLTRNIFKRMDK